MTEFFDKEYSAKEAYGRLFHYARKYRMRLLVGIIAGSVSAGSWVPIFQVIRPMLKQFQVIAEQQHVVNVPGAALAVPEGVDGGASGVDAAGAALTGVETAPRPGKEALPEWFEKAERLANRAGLTFRDAEGHMTGELLLLAFFAVPLVLVVKIISVYLNHYFLRWVGAKVVQDFRIDLFRHLQKQSLAFFGRTDVGQLMSRCTGDPSQIDSVIAHTLADLCRAPFEILVAFGYVIYFAVTNNMVETLILVLIGFPLFMLPMALLGNLIRKWSRRALQRVSYISSKIHENITCIRVVKAYHMEEREVDKYREVNQYFIKSVLRALRIELLVTPSVEGVGILLIFAFTLYCFMRKIAVHDIAPLLVPLLIVYRPMKQLGKVQAQIERGRAALARIFSLLDTDMSLPLAEHPVRKSSFDDRVRFDNVCFRYQAEGDMTIRDVSFEIEHGAIVAVVGGTGSGKTTLSNLLARFYDPSSGSVTMDGVDLRQMDMGDVRNLIGVVTQETVLFNDTIESNIAYGTPNATLEQVVAAAKMANAHEFIMAHPEGYGRVVGEKGFTLSGGERQRVAIARAILKNPPILILDEATSALDTVTERLVQDAINKLMANRTTFVIAHRLSTIRNADLILVMEKGVVIERGSHGELYQKNGIYRKLCDMQMME